MCRLARRCPDGEDGAIAILVAILVVGGVLMAMLAMTVDVGQLYAERRELQNGADAAVLAVAQDCAKGTTCDASTAGNSTAGKLANANAKDAASAVDEVCGHGHANLAPCPQSSTSVYDCPALPSANTKFVQVRTSTLRSDDSHLMPPVFARLLLGNETYDGTSVHACARAAWGPPSQVESALPVTISLCEWQRYTASGTMYAPPPPYTSGLPAGFEHVLYLHDTKGASGCPASPSGGDLPGGFGWLNSTQCRALVDENSWVDDDTGVSINGDCKDVIAGLVGKVIYLPIFDQTNDLTGSNGAYHIQQFVAFYLSGYNLPAAKPNHVDSAVGGRLCKGNDKCLYGWFTEGTVPSGGSIGGGPDMGVTTIVLIG